MNRDDIERVMGNRDITKGSWVTQNHINHLDMNSFSDETVWMITENGGWCFVPIKDNVYECHFGYNRRGLRRFAMGHTKECFGKIKELGADILIGMVASNNTLAKRFLERNGCKSHDRKDGPFTFANKKTDLEIYIKWL